MLGAIDVIAEEFFEHLYLVPRLTPVYAHCHQALGAHTPTAQSTPVSGFVFNFFPKWHLNFLVGTIHQVIWSSPGTLLLGTLRTTLFGRVRDPSVPPPKGVR